MIKSKLLAPILLACACLFFFSNIQAQRVGIKTNALYWATLSPNVGLEFRLSRHFTLNLEATCNLFRNDQYKIYTASFAPEVRYWLSARPQAGHFFGVMGSGNIFKWKLKNMLHDGDAIGGGITYGYSYVINKRWSLEATLGLGVLHWRDKKYPESDPLPKTPNNNRTVFAPLKAGLSFVYLIK